MIAACKEKKTAVILAIGNDDGYTPEFYSTMAKEVASRDKFVSSVMEILNEYDLRGVLISWEYPVKSWSVS
jgi:GH18 family chitinase